MTTEALAQLSEADRRELVRIGASPEEIEWAAHESIVVDPGTDSPAVKLRQRRLQLAAQQEKLARDANAEHPLTKFARVWGSGE